MMTDMRNLPRIQILIEISQMLLEILQTLSLGHIVWMLIQVSNPMCIYLPVSEPSRFHISFISWHLPCFNSHFALDRQRKTLF